MPPPSPAVAICSMIRMSARGLPAARARVDARHAEPAAAQALAVALRTLR